MRVAVFSKDLLYWQVRFNDYHGCLGKLLYKYVLNILSLHLQIAFKPKFLASRVEKERRAVLSELQMMNTIEYRVDCQVGTSSSLLSIGGFLPCFDSILTVNCVVLCIGIVCFWICWKLVIVLYMDFGFWSSFADSSGWYSYCWFSFGVCSFYSNCTQKTC